MQPHLENKLHIVIKIEVAKILKQSFVKITLLLCLGKVDLFDFFFDHFFIHCLELLPQSALAAVHPVFRLRALRFLYLEAGRLFLHSVEQKRINAVYLHSYFSPLVL